ncbi:hypothetical protein E4T47_05896 [Aureobasidium subglaciale]|nr:hypothetical protein E4T47_05896 [Aureobasidium subglaciale]
MMGYEWKRWCLSNIPDPKEPDSVLYALLASMVEALVHAFNHKLALGLRRDGSKYLEEDRHSNFPRETVPSWTAHVKALDTPLDLLMNCDGHQEGKAESNFSARNILAPMGDLYNV